MKPNVTSLFFSDSKCRSPPPTKRQRQPVSFSSDPEIPTFSSFVNFLQQKEKYFYSAFGLVVPRTEEQISAPIAVKKFKRPLISGWEGPSCCPKCSKLCYDQFGVTLEASNHPHLFTGRLPPGY